MAEAPPVWEFKDGAVWRQYTPEVVAIMEKTVAEGGDEAEYSFGQWKYRVFMQTMVQMNMHTAMTREVRRTPPLPAAKEPEVVVPEEPEQPLPPWLPRETHNHLRDILLSPATCTEKPPEPEGAGGGLATASPKAELFATLQRIVPGIDEMMDRTGQTPVMEYMAGTCVQGLPIYRDSPAVQQHTIKAIRFIFECAAADKPGAAPALQRLAEAYTSCQAEQGRTIDVLYGRLSGRDASLRDRFVYS